MRHNNTTISSSRNAQFLVGVIATISVILVLWPGGRTEAQDNAPQQAAVDKYGAGQWIEMGSGSATGGGISGNSGYFRSVSLAIGADGVPVIAWSDYGDGDEEIYVLQWNGTAWVEMGRGSASGGGISNSSGYSYTLSLAIGPNSAPVVAWEDGSETGRSI